MTPPNPPKLMPCKNGAKPEFCNCHSKPDSQIRTEYVRTAISGNGQSKGYHILHCTPTMSSPTSCIAAGEPDYWEDRILADQNKRLLEEGGYMAFTKHEHGELYPSLMFKDNETRAAFMKAYLQEKPPVAGDLAAAVETCRNWQQRDRAVDSVELSGAIETLILAATARQEVTVEPDRYKLQVGKWGMYVHDSVEKRDIDMEEVRDRMNGLKIVSKG